MGRRARYVGKIRLLVAHQVENLAVSRRSWRCKAAMVNEGVKIQVLILLYSYLTKHIQNTYRLHANLILTHPFNLIVTARG